MRVLALCLLFASIPASHAQSTAAAISARLMDKPLYLRGFWSSKTLHFNADGQLIGDSKPISFTLSGFELKKVTIKQNGLMLEGHRFGLDLANNQQKPFRLDLPIRIDIDAPPSDDYSHALDAIFATNLAELVPTLPSYWHDYAMKYFLPHMEAHPPSPSKPQQPKPFKIDGSIRPPRLIHSVEPDYPAFLRNFLSDGQTVINIWVTEQGIPSHFSIVNPIGMGADEDALAAIMQYRFAPATKDGKPVVVEVNIQINLRR